MHHICVIPGDGIGQEVIPATVRVLKSLDLDLSFTEAEAGWETFQEKGKRDR